jgi:hypothetical protein
MNEYHHENKTRFTEEECAEAVGKRAELRLAGEIVEARVSAAGPHVVFVPDERFGFRDASLVGDLELFEVKE